MAPGAIDLAQSIMDGRFCESVSLFWHTNTGYTSTYRPCNIKVEFYMSGRDLSRPMGLFEIEFEESTERINQRVMKKKHK